MAILLSWIAVITMFLGCEFVVRKNWWGFVWWTVSNAVLISKFAFFEPKVKWGMIALYVVGQWYTTRGLIRWRPR